jgi:hypothetical protein
MKQLEGYLDGDEEYLCKSLQSACGFDQRASEWNKKLNEVIITEGYKRSQNDQYLYTK